MDYVFAGLIIIMLTEQCYVIKIFLSLIMLPYLLVVILSFNPATYLLWIGSN